MPVMSEPATCAQALQAFLAQHLPLTEAMGVRVVEASDDRIEVAVPLEPNLNHEQTAFGGSISTLGILAGWGWFWTQLRHHDPLPRLLIGHSSTRYIRPVEGPFSAVCHHPGQRPLQQFVETFAATGKARLALRSEIRFNDKIAAVHDGIFVAMKPTTKGGQA